MSGDAFSTHVLDRAKKLKRQAREAMRTRLLGELAASLVESPVCIDEAYFFGSIVRPYSFYSTSDIDLAVHALDPHAISDKTFQLLDSLRSFRHVFRHAYGTSLDERKVRIVLEDARSLQVFFRDEFATFLSLVEESSSE